MVDNISTGQDSVQKKSQLRITLSQIFPVMVKNLLLMSHGLASGYATILIPSLSNPYSKEEFFLNEEEISWIGSLNLLIIPFGCMMSGVISQIIGRRITMQFGSFLLILAWIILRICNDVWQIYAALAAFGFASGILESPVLTYPTEIAQPRLRGSLLSSGQLFATFGIFLQYVFGSILGWRNATYFSAIPPLISFVLLFMVPESPYWLIMKNRLEDARKSLAWVRGWTTVEDIEHEFQEMVNSTNKTVSTNSSRFKCSDYTEQQFIKPFLLLFCLFLLYHFSGVTTIPTYAVKIFKVLDVPLNEFDATVFLGLAQFLGSLTCVLTIQYVGRRMMSFIGLIAASIFITITATYAYLTNIMYLNSENQIVDSALLEYNWIPLASIILVAYALNCSIRVLTWNLVSELFPTKTRGIATAVLGAISCAIGFSANKSFFLFIAVIKLSGTFWFYAGVGLIMVIITYFWVPETEGKSLEEINDYFSGEKKLNRETDNRNTMLYNKTEL